MRALTCFRSVDISIEIQQRSKVPRMWPWIPMCGPAILPISIKKKRRAGLREKWPCSWLVEGVHTKRIQTLFWVAMILSLVNSMVVIAWPVFFGDRSFRQLVYDEQEMFEAAENLPKLVKQPLEMERIVEVVAQAFNVDKATVLARQSGQRYSNTPRKVAMYCSQKHGDHKQKEIARYFNLNNPGSVSSAIQSICPALEAGALNKTYAVIQRDLNIVKLTWPPYSFLHSQVLRWVS